MPNRYKYGARWVRGRNGAKACPPPEKWPIASGYQAVVQGGNSVDLNPGDIVKRLSTGFLALAEGTEITGYNPPTVDADIAVGVIIGFQNFFDGQVLQPTDRLPGGTVYGTNLTRQSHALVVPLEASIWSIASDVTGAPTTQAAWQALVGQRVDFVNSDDRTGSTGVAAATPEIDISTAAVGATLQYTIFGLDPSEDNLDFLGTTTGEGFRLLIVANSYADAPNTVGI